MPKDKQIYFEGHPSLSMCFILMGEINVTRLTLQKETGLIIDDPIKVLGAGEHFGQLGLMYSDRRNASCTSKSK
jgi:CRP-like cAMP-binding protein